MSGNVQLADVNIQGQTYTFEQTKTVFSTAYLLRLLSGAPYVADLAQNGRNRIEDGAVQPVTPQFKADYWLQILGGATNGNGRVKTESKSELDFVEPMLAHWESDLWLRLLSGATRNK